MSFLKITVIAFLISIVTLKANAQNSIGFFYGKTYNHLRFNESDKTVAVENAFGSTYNVTYARYLDKSFKVESAVDFSQENYNVSSTAGVTQKFINNYLTIPLMMSFEKKTCYHLITAISFGGFISHWDSKKITGKIPNVFNVSSDSQGQTTIGLEQINYQSSFTDNDKRLGLGVAMNVTISYKLNNLLRLNARYGAYDSLSGQQRKSNFFDSGGKNLTQFFVIGTSVNLK